MAENPFDILLFIEEKLQKQGYEEGYEHGWLEGEKEAAKDGESNGKDVTWEIAYYYGFTEAYLCLLNGAPDQEKKTRTLSTLNVKLQRCRIFNIHSDDYMEEFSHLQAKYRQVLSILKVSVVVKNQHDISF